MVFEEVVLDCADGSLRYKSTCSQKQVMNIMVGNISVGRGVRALKRLAIVTRPIKVSLIRTSTFQFEVRTERIDRSFFLA